MIPRESREWHVASGRGVRDETQRRKSEIIVVVVVVVVVRKPKNIEIQHWDQNCTSFWKGPRAVRALLEAQEAEMGDPNEAMRA